MERLRQAIKDFVWSMGRTWVGYVIAIGLFSALVGSSDDPLGLGIAEMVESQMAASHHEPYDRTQAKKCEQMQKDGWGVSKECARASRR